MHYDDDADVNAFATLGGHIVVYPGLLEAVPDENALAMVLAHEIAHVRHRHPIVGLSRSAADATALETLARAYGHVGGADRFFRHGGAAGTAKLAA